jgi:rhomboid protease GluP
LFVHGDIAHLLSNSLFLSIFSFYSYSYFGLMSFPLIAVVGGVFANILTLWGMPENTYLVGASGIVYFLGAFWLLIYIFIERNRSLRYRILRGIGVSLVLFGPGAFSPEVSYMAHFWGFVLGLMYACILFYFKKTYFYSYEEFKMDVFESHGYSPKEFQ